MQSVSITVSSIPLYSVFDCVGQEYGPPFLSKNDQTALRVYRQMISREHILGTDYKLFRLGHFDSETGILVPSILEEIECAVPDSAVEMAKKIFPGSEVVK